MTIGVGGWGAGNAVPYIDMYTHVYSFIHILNVFIHISSLRTYSWFLICFFALHAIIFCFIACLLLAQLIFMLFTLSMYLFMTFTNGIYFIYLFMLFTCCSNIIIVHDIYFTCLYLLMLFFKDYSCYLSLFSSVIHFIYLFMLFALFCFIPQQLKALGSQPR